MIQDTHASLLRQANDARMILQEQIQALRDDCTRYLVRLSPDTKQGLFAALLSPEQLSSAYYAHTVSMEKHFGVIEQSVSHLCVILREADLSVFPEGVVACDEILQEYLILRAKLSEFSSKNEKLIRSESKHFTSAEAIRLAKEFRANVEHFLLFLQNHEV